MIALSFPAHAQIGYVNCVIGRPLPLPDILQDLLNAERHREAIKAKSYVHQDDDNCESKPTTKECAEYKSRQIEIEKSCVTYFRTISRTSCWYEKQLPKACEQYRNLAEGK